MSSNRTPRPARRLLRAASMRRVHFFTVSSETVFCDRRPSILCQNEEAAVSLEFEGGLLMRSMCEMLLRLVEIVGILQIHPELRSRLEHSTEEDRRFRRHIALGVDEGVHALHRHPCAARGPLE